MQLSIQVTKFQFFTLSGMQINFNRITEYLTFVSNYRTSKNYSSIKTFVYMPQICMALHMHNSNMINKNKRSITCLFILEMIESLNLGYMFVSFPMLDCNL